jgi:hypothetical protein
MSQEQQPGYQSPDSQQPGIGYQGGVVYDRDSEHLKILSIFWYVVSSLVAFVGCFPIIHISVGLVALLAPEKMVDKGGEPPPAWFGWLFVIIGSAVMLFCWMWAALGFITAWSLPQRRRIVVCYLAAGLACLQIPLGTLLGVFTFIVLARPSIKASFG